MKDSILQLWCSLSYLGLKTSDNNTESGIQRYRLLNQILGIILIAVLLLNFFLFINGNFIGLKFSLFFLFVSSLLLFLNSKSYFKISINLGVYLFAIPLNLMSLAYGKVLSLEIVIPFLTAMTIIFVENRWRQFTAILITLGTYYILHAAFPGYKGILTSQSPDVVSNVLVFITSLCTFFTLRLFMKENKRVNKENTSLIKTLKEKNKDLIDQKIEIEQQNKELENFAYIASHDLKSPLRTIGSFVNLIERKVKAQNDEELNEYLDFVKKGTKQMSTLIQDVLEFTTYEEEETDQVVDLNTVVFDIINNSPFISVRECTQIYIDFLPTLNMSKTHVKSLFQNLIENGIKYNESSCPIVKIEYSETATKHCFTINDNGIGIEEKYQQQIFEMFRRLHGKGQYEGTGIGLAICKKIIEHKGGEIWVNSKKGEGSKFGFTIPKNAMNQKRNRHEQSTLLSNEP